MTQIKKGNYIITIARVDGTIYIRSTGSVPKDIKQIIRQLNLNIWMNEETVSETLLKEIECREMGKCKKKTSCHRLQEVKK